MYPYLLCIHCQREKKYMVANWCFILSCGTNKIIISSFLSVSAVFCEMVYLNWNLIYLVHCNLIPFTKKNIFQFWDHDEREVCVLAMINNFKVSQKFPKCWSWTDVQSKNFWKFYFARYSTIIQMLLSILKLLKWAKKNNLCFFYHASRFRY